MTRLWPFGLLSLLAACVPPPSPAPARFVGPPMPSMLANPGPGKDRAQFDRDNTTCQSSAAVPNGDNIYAQCMISHGNSVQTTPLYPYRRVY